MLARALVASCCVALVSCSSSPASPSCGSAVLGASGGALVAGNGATLVVPPGALASATEVSFCVLDGFPPRRGQQSDLLVVRPATLSLLAPASFTIPIWSASISEARIEVGQSVDDAAPVVLTAPRATRSSLSFEHDHFGYLRAFGVADPSPPDSSFVDADRDAARLDAGPAPLAPVVVGVDLDPADYGCLGRRVVGAPGDPVLVDLHVVDWHDHAFRAGYQLRVLSSFPPMPDTEVDCSTRTDCVAATSDATGHASVTIPSGPSWIDVVMLDPSLPFTDDRHAPVRHIHLPIDVPAASGTVDVEAVSQRTHIAVGGFTFRFGQLSMGRVRDCDGQLVQRARVRVFDQVAGAELIDASGSMLTYGSTSGLPLGGRDRTGADGTFLVDNFMGVQSVRLEAWGQLTAGGPEVMLACELRQVASSTLVVGDLLPVAMDRPDGCSE